MTNISSERYYEMGLRFLEIGDFEKSENYFNKSLNLSDTDKNKAMCFNSLGYLYNIKEDFQKSENMFKLAIKSDPSKKEFYHNLINVLIGDNYKNIKEIMDLYKDKAYDQNNYSDNIFLSDFYIKNLQYEEAYSIYEKLLEKSKDSLDLYYRISTVCHILGDNQKCEDFSRKGLLIDPDNHQLKVLLGISQLYSKKIIEAENIFLDLKTDLYSKRWYLGYICFLQKKYEKAWEYYEVRNRKKIFPDIIYKKPLWNGISDLNKTVLVIAEQGFGDNIMAARWISNLKNHFKNVLYFGNPVIRDLMSTLSVDFKILNYLDDSIEYDYWLPIMSLPFRLKLEEKQLKCETPYFHILKKENKKTFKKKIGINWIGSHEHKNNRYRSFLKKDYYLIEELIKNNPNFEWFSLVKGEDENDCEYFNIPNALKKCQNIKESAEFINDLDVVVTIDNICVHLSGSLNKKTFLMLPWFPEWRWGLNGSSCIWYPSVEIFRQEIPFDWTNVISEIDKKIKNI